MALREDEAARSAREAFVEGVVKALAGELALVPRVREILLSGRLSRVPGFRDPVAAALTRLAPVRDLSPAAVVKEAARGAGLLADGLAGGPTGTWSRPWTSGGPAARSSTIFIYRVFAKSCG